MKILPLSSTEQKILNVVERELKIAAPTDIARKLGLNSQHIRNLVANLAKHEYLRRIVRGAYEITQKGKSILSDSGAVKIE